MKHRFVRRESVPVDGEPAATIEVLTLDRPDRFNAIGPRMAMELDAIFTELALSSARVVILTGAGGNFCSGGDLHTETIPLERPTDYPQWQQDEYGEMALWFLNDHFHVIAQRACRKLEDLPMPIIAAIDGAAVGVGLEMALSCDLRVCTEAARMAELAVPAGFMSEWGAPRNLPRLIGIGRATEMILTGRFVSPEEAVSIGLVNRVVPAEDLMTNTLALASQIAALPPMGVRYAKEMVRLYLNQNRSAAAMDLEMQRVMELTRTEQCVEGISAFLDKRPPTWRRS